MDWLQRFTQQATWTAELRKYLFSRADLSQTAFLLEIGCGPGAILDTLPFPADCIFGLDIDFSFLIQAHQCLPDVALVQGDAHRLPFISRRFDCVFFHFTLLWLADPLQTLLEARRLVRPGGWIIALAEPDYGGRIDYPDQLARLGQLQEIALRQQGADTHLGRRLGSLFHRAGLRNIESGVINGAWKPSPPTSDLDLEWKVIEADLQGLLPGKELAKMHQLDREAWRDGDRTLFVPTFYALGMGD